MGQQFPVHTGLPGRPPGHGHPVEVVAVRRGEGPEWVVLTVEGPFIPHDLVQHGDPRWS